MRALLLFGALALGLLLPLPGGGSGVRSVSVSPPATAVKVERRAPLLEPSEPFTPDYPRFVRATDAPEPSSGHRVRPNLMPARELLLTFDDGPELETTPLILEELDRRGLKAIFFVTGRHLVGHKSGAHARRELVRTIAAHGHMVANHTLTHQNLCRMPGLIDEEVDGNQEIITAATGIRPVLFRAPYGSVCGRLARALEARDLVQVGWNIDPQEWRGEDAEDIVDYVLDKLRRLPGRGILLLHDTHPQAARALPRILDFIDEENRRASLGLARPIQIVDYTVFLPRKPLPQTGLDVALADVGRRMVAPALERFAERLRPSMP